MAQHIKPEPKAMSLKTERAHTEPCIMKGKEKRSTPRFHIALNFWSIIDDKGSKSFQREENDPNTKD